MTTTPSMTRPALSRPPARLQPRPQHQPPAPLFADPPTTIDVRQVVVVAQRIGIPVLVHRDGRSHVVRTVTEYDQIPTDRKTP